jgi:hypothetical protein
MDITKLRKATSYKIQHNENIEFFIKCLHKIEHFNID